MVRKINVNCNFNGTTRQVSLYVGSPSADSHPLGFQAKWLSDSSGGKIPDEFMNSVAEIKEIADQNKVSFEELLCHLMKGIEIKNKKINLTNNNDKQ